MNKEMKKYLETVVESIIFSDNDAATAAFHDYISKKTQSILLGESDDEDCDDEDCDDKEDKDDKKNFIRRERYYGSYSRSFDVTGIDTDAIKAEYKDGVLNLTLPKKAPETPAAKKIDIQ